MEKKRLPHPKEVLKTLEQSERERRRRAIRDHEPIYALALEAMERAGFPPGGVQGVEGVLYAVACVMEADSREKAFDRYQLLGWLGWHESSDNKKKVAKLLRGIVAHLGFKGVVDWDESANNGEAGLEWRYYNDPKFDPSTWSKRGRPPKSAFQIDLGRLDYFVKGPWPPPIRGRPPNALRLLWTYQYELEEMIERMEKKPDPVLSSLLVIDTALFTLPDLAFEAAEWHRYVSRRQRLRS